MKKVGLYLSCDPSWGGTFQYALSILQTLKALEDAKKIELKILFEDEHWVEILKNNNIVTYQQTSNPKFMRGLFRLWKLFPIPLKLWHLFSNLFHPAVKTIRSLKCSLWFFPSQDQMSYFGSFRAATSIHDLMHRYESQFPEVGNAEEVKHREFHYKNICKFSSAILTDSNLGKDQVANSYGEAYRSKITVLPYIIPEYLESKKADDTIHSRMAIPKKYFFYPAQFWQHKNHIRLINAFARLHTEYSGIGLVLSGGKKNGYEEAVQRVKKLGLEGSVIFPGYVSEEEMISLYRRSIALVMPTFFGPTNIPPLEALSLGTKVIYSKIYAYDEFLPSGTILINPKDEQDIFRGLKDALDDQQEHSSEFVPFLKAKKEKFKNVIAELISNY